MATVDVGDTTPLRPHQLSVDVKVNPPGPGPGQYPQRAVIGEDNARAASFGGKNPRFRARALEKTPGPGQYAQPSTFVDQIESRRRSPTVARFSSAPRDPAAKHKSQRAPGPGSYGAPLPPHATPSFSFGGRMAQVPRSKVSKLHKSPGPGQYRVPSTFESTRVNSMQFSAPVAGFGTSARFPAVKKGRERRAGKGKVGGAGPGPGGSAGPGSGMGAQTLSTQWSQPVFRFGASGRQPLSQQDRGLRGGPGPGEYVPRPAMGIQKVSTLKTQPVFRFGTSKRDTLGTQTSF